MATSNFQETGSKEASSSFYFDVISKDDVELDIAIVGENGSGRSSFVNAIRGLKGDGRNAVKPGERTTEELYSFSHPENLNIRFWIHPISINDATLPCLEIEKYDAFLIFTAGFFSERHMQFAQMIKSNNKPFFVIRTMTDDDLYLSQKHGDVLTEMPPKHDLIHSLETELKELHFGEDKIYLINNHHLDKCDFLKLTKAIADGLPFSKKEYFIKIPKIRELAILEKFQDYMQEMENAAVIIPEIETVNKILSVQETDRVKSAVCLLKPSNEDPRTSCTGTGFYANVKLKNQNKTCIMTNYHVYYEIKLRADDMVVVFHYDSTEQNCFQILLDEFTPFAVSKELDYVLMDIDENQMRTIRVKPLLLDSSILQNVKKGNTVYIFQHPGGQKKQYSQGKVTSVDNPFIDYDASTMNGSSGSPVLVFNESKFSLVALHSKGVDMKSRTSNYNKGVLVSEILDHLHNGTSSIDGPTEDSFSKNIEKWKELKEAKIRIGITGYSDSGKSSFINAIRGIKDDDDDAAGIDVPESGTVPKEYEFPGNPNISFVRMPNIGTSSYPDLPTYCEKITLEDYDIFLIFTSKRITTFGLEFAKRVKILGKSTFFVRTKIDNDLVTNEKKKKPISEEEILRGARKNCKGNVDDLIFSEIKIFLINNYCKDKWDFGRLIRAISGAFPTSK